MLLCGPTSLYLLAPLSFWLCLTHTCGLNRHVPMWQLPGIWHTNSHYKYHSLWVLWIYPHTTTGYSSFLSSCRCRVSTSWYHSSTLWLYFNYKADCAGMPPLNCYWEQIADLELADYESNRGKTRPHSLYSVLCAFCNLWRGHCPNLYSACEYMFKAERVRVDVDVVMNILSRSICWSCEMFSLCDRKLCICDGGGRMKSEKQCKQFTHPKFSHYKYIILTR